MEIDYVHNFFLNKKWYWFRKDYPNDKKNFSYNSNSGLAVGFANY